MASVSSVYRIDAGNQFPFMKGLCHIIICTKLKPQNFIYIIIFGCQHDYRYIAMLPYHFAQCHTVNFRQHDIKQNEFYRFTVYNFKSFFTVICSKYLKAILLQAVFETLYNQSLVINNKYVHANLSSKKRIYLHVFHKLFHFPLFYIIPLLIQP
ncbi:hypothetical protein SDC9_188561 [bioreactor metagenome]|uniref:Uncharacterized protein n=1 Tax=bioreactor metagenome TaxID=1076179 RepID=A0A645HPP1_9ZZZZ